MTEQTTTYDERDILRLLFEEVVKGESERNQLFSKLGKQRELPLRNVRVQTEDTGQLIDTPRTLDSHPTEPDLAQYTIVIPRDKLDTIPQLDEVIKREFSSFGTTGDTGRDYIDFSSMTDADYHLRTTVSDQLLEQFQNLPGTDLQIFFKQTALPTLQAFIVNALWELDKPEETPTVLIIDDEPLMTELNSAFLNEAGFNTLTANTYDEATRLLQNNNVGIILTDKDRQTGDNAGPEWVKDMREQVDVPPVALMSGDDIQAIIAAAEDAKIDAFIKKPFTTEVSLAVKTAYLNSVYRERTQSQSKGSGSTRPLVEDGTSDNPNEVRYHQNKNQGWEL